MAFRKLEISEFKSKLDIPNTLLVCRASFEARASRVDEAVSTSTPKAKLVFYSENESVPAKRQREQLSTGATIVTSLPTSDPLETDTKIANAISELLSSYSDEYILVDITCFRREELLILLRHIALQQKLNAEKVLFAYVAAEKMGSWLSKNPRSTRSVVGFPGFMDPLQPTHLVVLLGFEDHRVKEIINSYEPKNISLGISSFDSALSEDAHERNVGARNHLVAHFDNITKEFDFSATDPPSVMRTLEAIVTSRPNHNSIIAPLHTKLSTLGVGMFALRRSEVQICYTEVEKYNTEAFSNSGGTFFLGNLTDLSSDLDV